KTIAELKLLPYQSAFAANRSRFKIGLWARQTGKDHTATAEAVMDCYHNPGTTWIIVAASERQALESLAKAKEWAIALKLEIEDYTEAAGNVPYSVARTASTEIRWSNGSRLIALPANPSTIRGYSANLILTEFAFHENPDAIWRAIYPAISNPLRGGVKKLRIISTPNGLNNRFAKLWQANYETDSPIFHATKVTIHDAIRSGLPLDPNELQAGLNDPEAWAQEYLCEFMDNSTVLLPYDLIETCESPLATELSNPQSLSASAIPGGHRPELFAGIDFARKNHLTVCWILEKLPAAAFPSLAHSRGEGQGEAFSSTHHSGLRTQHFFLTREVLCLRNTSTPEQLELLRPRLNLCRKVSLDYTGPGIGLGDFLHREMGSRVELCPFTAPFKAELFPRLAAAMESRQLLIPIGRDIREDLHSIYRITTNSGNILYRAHGGPCGSHTDGHADRTTALALSLRAAQSAPQHACASNVGRKYRYLGDRSNQRTLAIIY
ncbi:MAG: terminase large subunit domain-containing protein, partial [Limisphaerales bacterium]